MKCHILIFLSLYFAFSLCSCTKPCPTCDGHKTVKVETDEVKHVECSYCRGTGNLGITCTHCNDDGYSTCNKCGGSGYVGKGKHKEKCPHCDKGKVGCWYCWGTTIVQCGKCSRRGYNIISIYKNVTCETCKGKGYVSKF